MKKKIFLLKKKYIKLCHIANLDNTQTSKFSTRICEIDTQNTQIGKNITIYRFRVIYTLIPPETLSFLEWDLNPHHADYHVFQQYHQDAF